MPAHGPAWTAARLRCRLAATADTADPAAHLPGDHGTRAGTGRRTPAAVLIAIVERDPSGPTVLLTQRTAHLRDHAGQISFPGGRMEAVDDGPVATALREAEEEVGLAPERVEVLGCLPTYDTITGFRVHPVVGWVRPPARFRPDPFEVAEVFEVPLAFVLDPVNHQRRSGERAGVRREFYVLPYRDRLIWGATAGMLVNLARVVGPG